MHMDRLSDSPESTIQAAETLLADFDINECIKLDSGMLHKS